MVLVSLLALVMLVEPTLVIWSPATIPAFAAGWPSTTCPTTTPLELLSELTLMPRKAG